MWPCLDSTVERPQLGLGRLFPASFARMGLESSLLTPPSSLYQMRAITTARLLHDECVWFES